MFGTQGPGKNRSVRFGAYRGESLEKNQNPKPQTLNRLFLSARVVELVETRDVRAHRVECLGILCLG